MNGGSTFVLQAGGGTVGLVQNVGDFQLRRQQRYREPRGDLPWTARTLNGASTYTFLTYNTGPALGVQPNWNIAGGSTITWAGTGDTVHWNNIPNWSGVNASGGTVKAVPKRRPLRSPGQWPERGGQRSAVGLQCRHSEPRGATVTGPAAPRASMSLTLGSASGGVNTLNLSDAASWTLPARPARRSTPRAC